MTELGYSYSTYESASFSAPLFFFSLIPLVVLIVEFIYLLVIVIKKDFDRPVWNSVYKGLRQIYGDQLDKRDGNYYLFNWKVPRLMLFLLFSSFVSIMVCTVVSFWSELLLTETDECTPDMDCFAFNQTEDLVQNTPLLDNCTEFQDNNYIIRCYKFSINYVNAIGNSGSVLVVGSLVMNVQSALASGAYSIENKKLRTIACVAFWIYILFGLIVLFLIPLFILIAPLFRAVVSETRNASVQYSAYFITFNVAFTVAGPVFATFIWHRSRSYSPEQKGIAQ